MARTLAVNSSEPEVEAINQAVRILKEGGVVVFPTTGLYGLAAKASDPQAVAEVFRIKGRPDDKPLLILVDSIDQVKPLVREVPESGRLLMEKLWPGGITLVFCASDLLPPSLLGGKKKIGIRMAAHPVARALVKGLGEPITGTSANLSGEPGAGDFGQLSQAVLDRTPLALDAGQLAGGAGSTVVDVTEDPPLILRQGAAPKEKIFNALKTVIQ
ncbi:L-threonylcarbamoyladenylate synthase [Desulfatibacillum aliphaticivorans]|uniref:L-threonylcarbamoyladenylate synthase n=1 Tax=Desulfatibacillum aliphaticivorans TaxID=218208 RepID=UPI0005585647|nr:L-threonylcarbamoyladenylate synthase [Desulfatibacillum aliphaticivorans]